MTLTATPPATSPDDAPPSEVHAVEGGVAATGDHKRIGRLFLGTALVLLALGAAIGALAHLGVSDGDRLLHAHTTTLVLLSIGPAWIGLLTHLVPLQIGAPRFALPRLQALAYWLYVVGAVVTLAGIAIGPSAGEGLWSLDPIAATAGREASTGTQLWITGLVIVSISWFLAAVGIATTVLTRRAPGLTLDRAPALAWTGLVWSGIVAIAMPTFLAGLALLYLDQRYGGSFFSPETRGTFETWLHLLWLPGRPELWLLALPLLGVLAEAVQLAARRGLLQHQAALLLIGLAGMATLSPWATDPDVARTAATVPFQTPALLALAGPPLLLLLLCLGTVGKARDEARVVPGIAAIAAAIVLQLVALAVVAAALITDADPDHALAFGLGAATLAAFGPGTLGIIAAATIWAPKLVGRRMPMGASLGATGLVLVGSLVAGLAGTAVGLGADPGVDRLAGAGLLLLALGALALLAGLAPAGRAGEVTTIEDDPYGGLTLEWATTSPPPPGNFATIPEVRSATPLLDDRTASTTTDAGASA